MLQHQTHQVWIDCGKAENFNAVVGAPLQTMISAPALRRLIDGGMAGQDASRLWVTAKGRPVLDSVLGALLA